MPRNTLFLTFFALTLIGGSSIAADDCPRNPNPVAHEAGQDGPSELRFTYESRVERQGKTKLYIWCVESDKANANIGEFRWGDNRDDSRYLRGLVEPGKGLPSTKTDPTKHASATRRIKFTRKNREEWGTVDTATITSKQIGFERSFLPLVRVQLPGSPGVSEQNLDRFKDEDGAIQIDRLSTDRDAFLSFLREQKDISAGGSLVVTIPTRAQVSELLHKNAYEKYDAADFVRANAALISQVNYNDGNPILSYWVSIVPEDKRAEAKLDSLLSDKLVSARVIPSEGLKSVAIDNKPITLSKFGSVAISQVNLGDRLLVFTSATLEIAFGREPAIGRFEAPLFAPK